MSKHMLGVAVLVVMVAIGLAGAVAWAAPLDSSVDLDAAPPIPLAGGTENVTQATAGAWTGYYDFGDKNGDGTRDDPVSPAGLSMGTHSLYSDMDNSASIKLNLNGGDLTATSGKISTSNKRATGDIHIYDVGTIAMGDAYIDSGWYVNSGYGGAWDPNGSTLIGQDGTAGPRAGNVQVAGISSATWWNRNAGDVIIHSSGDVLIQDSGGTPKPLRSDMIYVNRNSGDIQVHHDGTFVAGDITATVRQGVADPGDLLFDGDTLGNGASGTFSADLIDTHDLQTTWGAYGGITGTITIQGYTEATIGNVDTRMKGGYTDAGFLSVTGITNDITITGTIDLDGVDRAGYYYDGELTLACGGTITLEGGLDCGLFDPPASGHVFDPGVETFIEGLLDNVDTDDATVTEITSPDVVWYYPLVPGNEYLFDDDVHDGLQDGVWALSGGGLLKPIAPPVPEPGSAALALLGLAALSLRRRRS